MDVVEKIGVERSKAAVSDADLILLVLNANEELHEDELALMEQIHGRQCLVIMNKMDLPPKLDKDKLHSFFEESNIVPMSVLEEEGLDKLEDAISTLFLVESWNRVT